MRQPLGELLVSAGGLTPEQVQLAEQRQKELGGRLDTSVLELGLLSEDVLAPLLARSADLPLAAEEMVTAPDAGLAEILPRALAEKHIIAPVAIERRQLALLVCPPIDLTVLDDLGFLLSRSIRAYVAPELRVRQRQAQVYRQPMPDRFELLLRTHRTLPAVPVVPAGVGVSPEVASTPTPIATAASTPTVAPTPTAASAPTAVPTPTPTLTAAQAATPTPTLTAAQAPASDGASPPAFTATAPPAPAAIPLPEEAAAVSNLPPPSTLADHVPPAAVRAALVAAAGRASPLDALELVRAATTRDGILSAVLAYVRSAFQFVALYARRGGSMIVFEASGDGLQGADLEAASLTLDRASVLRTVAEARAPYVGPVPAGDPLERALGEMGRARLRAVLLYPVVIRDRTVLVVYGDGGGEALAPRQLSDVALVLSQVGAALERVILLAKRRAQTAEPPPLVPTSTPPPPVLIKKKSATLRWGAAQGQEAPAQAASSAPAASVEAAAPIEIAGEAPTEPLPAAEPPVAIAAAEELPSAAEPAPPTAAEPPLLDGHGPPALPASPAATASELDRFADAARAELDPATLAPLAPLEPPLPEAPPAPPAPPPPARKSGLEFDLAIDWVDPEVPPEPSYADLVRTFLAGKADTRAAAERKLLTGGAAAAEALAARFPGPLYVFRLTFDELPEPRKLGPLIGLLGSMGEAALPALAAVADGAGEEKRFWATVLLAKMGHPACLPPLVRRVFDPAPDVAQAARRGLWSHRRQPEYARALEQIELEMGAPDPARASQAIRALGTLHHVPAVPRLIELTESRQAEVAQAAAQALRDITLQDFGHSERRWQVWWTQARGAPRTAWLVEALDHRDPELRLAAIAELAAAAGQDFGYKSDLPATQRAHAVSRWREWWQSESRGRAAL
ncbi:MAG TPA: hypothetical protein VMB50_12090 [Myxococcales bacterium]|nr:hypothetical protein [Myxococcales bacterium]